VLNLLCDAAGLFVGSNPTVAPFIGLTGPTALSGTGQALNFALSWVKDAFFLSAVNQTDYSLWSSGRRIVHIRPEDWKLLPKYVMPKLLDCCGRRELYEYKDRLFQLSLLPRLNKLKNVKHVVAANHFALRVSDGKMRIRKAALTVVNDAAEFEPAVVVPPDEKSVSVAVEPVQPVNRVPLPIPVTVHDNYVVVQEEKKMITPRSLTPARK